jgi:hypothetical protein
LIGESTRGTNGRDAVVAVQEAHGGFNAQFIHGLTGSEQEHAMKMPFELSD